MKPFKTKYGHFSKDGTEYIITDPRTPRPWINVISNGDYGITISQTGSGYSWRTHGQLNRITRWDQDLIKDEWGKYIYLRDEKGNVWSAGWKPVGNEPDSYECRHGIGYTVITSRNFGIETELLVFLPNDEPVEIWKLTVRNLTRRPRTINLYTYFEWALGQSPDWHREFHKAFIRTEFNSRANAILATKRLWEVPTELGHWNTDWPFTAFHASSIPPLSFDTDKETFLGMYRNQSMPAGVGKRRLEKREGNWLDPVGSLHAAVKLRPKGEQCVYYSLGCADSANHAIALARRFQSGANVEEAFADVKKRWASLLNTVQVSTPDDALNVMENVWLKYQAISGRLWGRTAYYQTGGAFGFRDQLQDSQMWLVIAPEKTEAQLRLHARHQFKNGEVYHWWHPMSEVGMHNQITDNLLWLPYVMNSYLLETGDDSILGIEEPFVDDLNSATMYDHCVRAIDRALERFSVRGLPLIGAGDWNDGLSAVGLGMKGESIWLGHFLVRILSDFSVVARRRNETGRADRYVQRADALKETVNGLGWDGEYYYGATKDDGGKIGSRENTEGTVWLNPQTWAVIAGVSDTQRSSQVMDVVEKQLEKEIGPVLVYPSYKTPDKHVGYLTRYAAGMRENGGVYTHAATWAVMAAAMLGRGEAAFRFYSKINPVVRGMKPDKYCAEPYVTPGNIEGPDSAFYGRGGWTWYSGSAAWLFKVGLEWILGIRPVRDGLLIDPCIPSHWDGFKVQRTFRGATYSIEVRNPNRRECGVRELRVDGQPSSVDEGPRGKIVRAFQKGTSHDIVAILG